MTPSRPICPECGDTVPEGRLSCPSCGALLAAVRGGSTAPTVPARAAEPPAPVPPERAGATESRDEAEALAPSARVAPWAPDRRAAPEPAAGQPTAAARPSVTEPAQQPQPSAGSLRPNQWHSSRRADAAPDATEPRSIIAGRAAMLSDLPFEAPDTPAGWMAAIGSWLVALAFPLPWISSPFLGWFASWGFSPTVNVVPFALALAVALATITPSRLRRRIRIGYLPAAAGLVAFGMAWSSILLVAPAIGLIVLFLGGVLASAGGIWTLVDEDQRARLL